MAAFHVLITIPFEGSLHRPTNKIKFEDSRLEGHLLFVGVTFFSGLIQVRASVCFNICLWLL